MLGKSSNDKFPPGFKLRHTLRGGIESINQIAWSPDGRILASSITDGTLRLWNAKTGKLHMTLEENGGYCIAWSPKGHVIASTSDDQAVQLWNVDSKDRVQTLTGGTGIIHSVAWSPDERTLASGSSDKLVNLWDAGTGSLLRTFTGHSSDVNTVAWSPDGQMLASGSSDTTIVLWDAKIGQLSHTLMGHSHEVSSVAWSPDGQMLASGSSDTTIRLWEACTGRQKDILEGHTGSVICVSFSSDGRLLASKSHDGSIRFWRTDSWELVATLNEPSSLRWKKGLTFHPKEPVLATLGEKDRIIRIWNLDFSTLLSVAPVSSSVHYKNAKVVLVGDSGVGKSALGLVLNGKKFTPTESTHGRHIWSYDNQEVKFDDGRRETRETFLWDLAGQPSYRLIHQLHLNEVALALVVFDYHNETEPFTGVQHWERALRLAHTAQGASASKLKKFLVEARTDRGGRSVSLERIEALVQDLGFEGHFETSAKEGWGIAELDKALRGAIDWEGLPQVSSTRLFQRIKAFLVAEKKNERLLSPIDDLYRAFLKSRNAPTKTEDLRAQFETCIGLVESQGLIQKLSFGNLVLLQPELLDAYASALIIAVQNMPDGLGSIAERKVLEGDFAIPTDERLKDRQQEKLLLLAMVEGLLHHEIALYEQGSDGPYLVFPSQFTRENPDLTDAKGKAVTLSFEGPVLNIYTTLVVRLSHSDFFKKKKMWKNQATYLARVGGTCGMLLHNIGEGRGELTLFFDKTMSMDIRFLFEDFIKTHLERRALPGSIQQQHIFVCPECDALLPDEHVKRRRERGFDTMKCGVCETDVPLRNREERPAQLDLPEVQAMDQAADAQREREAAASILQGKTATKDFDVFLCYNSEDRAIVKEIGERLKELGILPWLDESELRPGLAWQRLLEQQIKHIKSAAVFVGKQGIGPWQQQELDAFLREFTRRGCPVIPTILANAPKRPRLPIFLKGMTWVDFRKKNPDPIERLIWGITGRRGAIR